MRRYSGLAKRKDIGISGLVTLIREPLLRPVQIVRQFISNHETRIAAYHANQGLSSALKTREPRRITTIPIGITNQVSGICGYAAMRFVRNKVWNK